MLIAEATLSHLHRGFGPAEVSESSAAEIVEHLRTGAGTPEIIERDEELLVIGFSRSVPGHHLRTMTIVAERDDISTVTAVLDAMGARAAVDA